MFEVRWFLHAHCNLDVQLIETVFCSCHPIEVRLLEGTSGQRVCRARTTRIPRLCVGCVVHTGACETQHNTAEFSVLERQERAVLRIELHFYHRQWVACLEIALCFPTA